VLRSAIAALLAVAPVSFGAVPTEHAALIRQYCAGCHNDRNRTSGISFTSSGLDDVPADAQMWERVIRKLRAGAMPPLGTPRPDRKAIESLVSYLENSIDSADIPHNPGPAGLRRLNRTEYGAAVRDLLSIDVNVAAFLPADDASHGFDNNSGSLTLSPALLEGYVAASRTVSRLAVGDPAIVPAYTTYKVRADMSQDSHVEGLPLGTRGGLLVEHYFPLDGDYVLKTKLAVNTSAKVRGLDYQHRTIVTVDGEKVHEAKVGGPADVDAAALSPPDSEADILKRLEVRVPVKAGPHKIGVAFLRKTSALPDGYLQPWLRTNFDTQEQRGIPFVESLSVGGPFDPAGSGDTPSRRRIFLCHPATERESLPCATKIVSSLARHAWRRPVAASDLEIVLGMYKEGGENTIGSAQTRFEGGIENALRFLLTSPEFIFRLEKAGTGVQVSDVELASRLSFFLWSSLPDDHLIDLANRGKLREPAVLEGQVRRMLSDARSSALGSNFAAQWLYLRNLAGTARDLEIFPFFDDNLRQGFRQETELFFNTIVHDDKSVMDLLTADYTFVNERLARHYGIPNVQGSYFRRVHIPAEARRGLLGHGSILTVTSYPTRTSPVLRGKWLLENVLGTPIPPPPPDIPSLAENHTGVKPRSVRERMDEHRANPACAVCHNIMDPLGFALENFDATGAWRTRTEADGPVDASGVLVDGSKVDGPVALRRALLERPEAFVNTFTEKLMTYALGRGIDYYDMTSLRAVVRQAAASDYRMSALILGIVRSAPFQMKGAGLQQAGMKIQEKRK
jgi:hypothetical protein